MNEPVIRCPDCNAEASSKKGLSIHRNRGGCQVIPNARKRAAEMVADYFIKRVEYE